jgi:hypothetical protein
MALGGIPVSGGASGHGTLIHTNLLYSPLLRDAYGVAAARPAYTLGGSAGVTGFAAAFVADRDPKTLWKTSASAGAISLTMVPAAPAAQVYGLALVGHNLTVAGVTSAKFEGGNGNYTDLSKDIVINASTLTPAYYLMSTAEIAAAAAYDRWRLINTFTGSAALQVGEVFLIGAAPLSFTRNYNKGFVPDLEIGEVKTESISGIKRIYTRWERLRYEFEFTDISVTQLVALQLAARNGHVIFSPNGSDGAAYFGTIELQPPKNISAKSVADATYSVTVIFTEAAV